MSRIQNENYNLIEGRIKPIERKLSESDAYGAIRRELIETRKSLGGLDLHPNAVKKFHDWITKLFSQTNEKEKNFILATLSNLEQSIAGLENSPLSRVDMNALREQVCVVSGWCDVQQNILKTKSGRAHAVDNNELTSIQSNTRNLKERLEAVQKQRTASFQSSLQKFQNDLAHIEDRINGLSPDSPPSEFKGMFNELKEIQNRAKHLPKAKREKYWQQISERFEQLKEIRNEKRNAARQLESQTNYARFNRQIDEVEDILAGDVISKDQLRAIKDKIFNEIWNPLKENNADNRYKVFLIRSDRNELFERMRNILEQIDQRDQVNHQYVQECKANAAFITEKMEEIFERLQECRQEVEEGFSMRDREILEKLNSVMGDIKACHRQIKTGHFFMKDRRGYQTNLSQIWADADMLIQSITNPQFDFDWLNAKIKQNINSGDLFIAAINSIPRA